MRAVPLMQVDAFSATPLRGNPAAVCWLEQPRDVAWMQAVAAEMNLSETAFIEPRAEGFGLRWFTPVMEVDLCGHATLGSAHALRQWGRVAVADSIAFHTRSGRLTAMFDGHWIVIDLPARAADPTPVPRGLEAALGGVKAIESASGPGPVGPNWLLELESEDAVRQAAPDFGALRRMPIRSVTITAKGSSKGGAATYDFVSRFFAPVAGVNEDPVTGSAHCQLATYWSRRLEKTRMLAYQASARGGELRVELAGERVRLGGQSVTVFQTELQA